MNQLNSFLKLIYKASDIHEFEDRIEFQCKLSNIKQTDTNYGRWLETDVIGLRIGTEWVHTWEDIEQYACDEQCFINFHKDELIKNHFRTDLSAKHFVFFTIQYFKEWLEKHSNPFSASHPLYNEEEKNILWVSGLPSEQIGCFLSLFPIGVEPKQYFITRTESLPGDEEIRSHVHFVLRDGVTVIPERFRLPDSAYNIDELKPFFINYTKLLAVCLVKEFYSEDKVVVSGLKRISLSLIDKNKKSISLKHIESLEQAVRWVYAEKTETRLILLMDRVSLDLPEGGDIIPSIFDKINQALDQAKYRYEFVIKDRQEAHAKELADLQKDVKSSTDSYSNAVNSMVSGLLKDGLSSVFVIAIGVVSKFIGQGDILISLQGQFLFKGLAVYLLASILIRLITNHTRLFLSENDIAYWKNTTRNHMSESEVKKHIESRIKPYKWFNRIVSGLTLVIYLILCFFVWNLPDFMNGNFVVFDQVKLFIDSVILKINP
jgi:hypothetical protein